MGKDPKITTTVSTKGQLVLPAEVRRKHGWKAGTKLYIEDTPRGVLLKEKSSIGPPTRPEDVFGMLKYKGPPISIEDMDKAIEREVRRRHSLGEY